MIENGIPMQYANYPAPGFAMLNPTTNVAAPGYHYAVSSSVPSSARASITDHGVAKIQQQAPVNMPREVESEGSDGSSAGGSSGPQSLGLITFADHPGEELSIGALKQLSERWAVKDGFTQEQRTEFGHLMSMVTSTYIPKNKLSRLREIDAGSFGKIYATTYDGCDVAVKQISNTAGSGIKAKMRELLLELRVLVRVRHPNVVTFWGTATEFPAENSDGEPYMGLVFELCPRASLHTALFEDSRKLTLAERLKIAHQTALGLAYLHTKRVIHRDVNPRNILLAADLTPKIADFGCARVLSSTQMTLKTTTISGSPAYMAPEQIKGDDLSFAVDTWGMGVMLWEMMTNTKPWEGRFVDFNGLKKAIVNGERLHTPRGTPFPSSYVRSIALCMAMQADKRPGMAVVAAELKKAIK